jgi:hypothetical protein
MYAAYDITVVIIIIIISHSLQRVLLCVFLHVYKNIFIVTARRPQVSESFVRASVCVFVLHAVYYVIEKN